MPDPASKVVVIGVDAANPTLLRRWAEEGVLPNVRTLLDRGLTGSTRSVDGFFVGSTWPSFYTGVTPARHGCHYLLQLKPGTYDLYPVAGHGVARYEPFWRRFSRAGRRVAVLDVPLSRVDPSLNGIQTVEWGGHDAVYGFGARPADLAKKIRTRFGAHPLRVPCDDIGTTADDYERFILSLIEGARVKGELTRHFLRQGSWDFFMQVFTESHCVGHQCWHLHAPDHPAHDVSIAAQTGDPLRRVYVGIDHSIGEIVSEAGDTLIILLVAHGMSHWYGANFLLRDILCRLGVARPLEGTSTIVSSLLDRGRRAWQILPRGIRSRVARLRASVTAPVPGIGVDPRSSLCFPHRNGQPVSGIRLNLLGREPYGILPPTVAGAFCDELTWDLLNIVDEGTGRPLVRRVLRTRDLYAGEFVDDLPDVLVEWSDEVPIGSEKLARGAGATIRARSPKLGVIEGVNRYGRTGDHRPEGMFIAAGPRVRPGEIDRQVSILDFAPTFTSLLGVDWVGGDGQPVKELLGK